MDDLYIKYMISKTLTNISKQKVENKFNNFRKIDIPLLSISLRDKPIEVSRKKIRLYIDLIDEWYPLYKNADINTKLEFITDVFKCNCSIEDINRLKSFKDITKKQIITLNNEQPKTISRLRWRSRANITKNIIHFTD
jgi:hypothetical protein